MSVAIYVDTTGLDRKIYDIENGLNRAMRAASKRATAHGKTKMDAVVRERVAVPKAAVMQQIHSEKSGQNGQKLTLKKSDRVSLRRFGARQTRAGVTYKIAKGGKRRLVPSAFIVESLHGQVFKRVGAKRAMTKGRYVGQMKQPIQKLWGPSVWGAFTGGKKQKTVKDATPDVSTNIARKLRERLEHEVSYIISKANK